MKIRKCILCKQELKEEYDEFMVTATNYGGNLKLSCKNKDCQRYGLLTVVCIDDKK